MGHPLQRTPRGPVKQNGPPYDPDSFTPSATMMRISPDAVRALHYGHICDVGPLGRAVATRPSWLTIRASYTTSTAPTPSAFRLMFSPTSRRCTYKATNPR